MTRLGAKLRLPFVLCWLMAIVASTAHPASAAEGSLESELFGITIGWSDAWRDDLAHERDGNVQIRLLWSNEVMVTFRAAPSFGGDEEVCLENSQAYAARNPANSRIRRADEDPLLPFAGGTTRRLQMDWQPESGSAEAWYLEAWCRTLQHGFSTLQVELYAPIDDLEEIEDDVADLTVEQTDEVPAPEFPMAEMRDDLSSFWAQQFETWREDEYRHPTYVAFDEPINSFCGLTEPLDVGWFYCADDWVIYMDEPAAVDMEARYGPAVNIFLLAHETGHHVATSLGFTWCPGTSCLDQLTDVQYELMADCLAGAWFQNAEARRVVTPEGLDAILVAVADTFGDPTHGTGADRLWWLLQGYYLGPNACFTEPPSA